MAFIAAATGVKDLPAALGGAINGVLVPGDEVIKRRIKRQLCSFVGRDGAHQVGAVGRAAEDTPERLLVFFDGCDPGRGSVQAGLSHLNRIDDRQGRLLLERLHPAVPELRLVVESVQNGRRVALADAAFDTDRSGPPVGESVRRIMARTACHGPVSRQTAIEEQSLAEGDLLGSLRIVSRYRRASRAVGDANLSKRLWPGQQTRFGNGRCFRGDLLRRFVQRGLWRRTRRFARTLATENQRSGTYYQHKRDTQLCSLCNPHPTALLSRRCIVFRMIFSLPCALQSPLRCHDMPNRGGCQYS